MSRNHPEIIQLLESIISMADEGIKAVKSSDDLPGTLYDDLKRIDILLDEALFDLQNPD
jgi:hypothetical protein